MLSEFRATLLEIMYKAKDHIKNSLKKRQNLQQYMKTHTFYLYFELLHFTCTLSSCMSPSLWYSRHMWSVQAISHEEVLHWYASHVATPPIRHNRSTSLHLWGYETWHVNLKINLSKKLKCRQIDTSTRALYRLSSFAVVWTASAWNWKFSLTKIRASLSSLFSCKEWQNIDSTNSGIS